MRNYGIHGQHFFTLQKPASFFSNDQFVSNIRKKLVVETGNKASSELHLYYMYIIHRAIYIVKHIHLNSYRWNNLVETTKHYAFFLPHSPDRHRP